MHRTWRAIFCSALMLSATAPAAGVHAQQSPSWTSDAAGAQHFLAVHGERGAVFGYSASGLEIWSYPLQVLSGYRLLFHVSGALGTVDGRTILSRIEYYPTEVVRVYNGTGFVVREHIFTPLHEPGAIFSYEVEGRPSVAIEARFQPSLDLMWPGALGGQSVIWDAARSGYLEREPVHGFSAIIRSPDAIDHDAPTNRTSGREDGFGLLLRPTADTSGARRASLVVASDPSGVGETTHLASTLGEQADQLRAEAASHDETLLASAVQVITPDAELNRALSGAILALDQGWVCAPALGCGEVAGYGPSRPGRRPQYAWFFGGDGLVAVRGLLAAGEFERAREELAFIARYQNPRNGMIWHELSLSAPLIDWERRYPYMFVHVDITFQYLATLERYLSATGDVKFVSDHWTGIDAAWRYCRSIIDQATGLPEIPAGKEGGNEQDQMRDDIALSSAWIEAADAYAKLARAAGRTGQVAEAENAAAVARRAVAQGSWDSARQFWVTGHTLSGAPISDERPSAIAVLGQDVFSADQVDAAFDRLAGPDFQTDWGVRSLSARSPRYDPNAYSSGSVSALGTSEVATSLWKAHRPLTAWSAWRALVGWSSLDSGGHMHEVLAGDLYHPEMESTPEQTWSSAGLLASASAGLLGLEPLPLEHRLVFAPHLPADWPGVTIRNLRVGSARLELTVTQKAGAIALEVRNDGPAVAIDFAPEIPLGAHLLGAEVNGAARQAAAELHAQDQHGRLRLVADHGVTRAVLRFSGGVRLSPVEVQPRDGDASRNMKIASAAWSEGALQIRAFVADPTRAAIEVVTPLAAQAVDGGRLTALGDGRYQLVLERPTSGVSLVSGYTPVKAMIRFKAKPNDR